MNCDMDNAKSIAKHMVKTPDILAGGVCDAGLHAGTWSAYHLI